MKNMRWEKVDGYTAALILSEGRYEARMRREMEEIRIPLEPLKKSEVVRVSDTVVRRIRATA